MGKEEEIFQGKVVKTFHLGSPGAILACGLARDDKVAASCTTNKKVLLWDVNSGRCIGSLDGHQADVTCCCFGDDLLVTGSRDGILYLWKYKEMKRTSRIDVHAGPVHSCVISPNSRFLASSSEDTTVRVYTIRAGDGEYIQGPQCKELRGHTDGVNDVSFSADSCAIVTACTDGSTKIWDTATGECLMTLEGENGKVFDARFSADGSYIVTLTRKCISVWNIAKNRVSYKVEDDKGFQALCCHPTENFFLVVSMDGTIAGHSISSKSEIFKKHTEHRGPVLTISYSLSGNTAVTGGIDGKIFVWR